MRIVIDGRMYQESGVGRYIRNLIDQLETIDKKNEYYILMLPKDYDTYTNHSNFKKVSADFKWYGIGEQTKLPGLLNKLKPDLVHFPHFNVPIFYRGKFVVTIHDLIHQHFQMRRSTTLNPLIYKIKQLGYDQVFKRAMSKSACILVPSNHVKKLLTDEMGIRSNKVTVTPEGVDDKIFRVVSKINKNKSDKILEKFNIKPPFIFYVGNAHPHKNVEGLIKAFLEIRKKYKQYLTLVLSGNDHYFWHRIKQSLVALPLRKEIIFTGHVSDEELVALYKSAQAFVMPSFEEGFGIPLLEAMAVGCPVVSSNAASLPEVAGNAAIYFDPKDENDMTTKISKVLNNEKLRKELIEKGRKRVKQFSWKKLAEQTLEVYRRCG